MSDFETLLADRLAPRHDRYYDDPVLWATECIDWPEGEGLTKYQATALRELVTYGRESVRSLHGAGKTTTAAIAILWFAETRDRAGVDWKAITTATAWRQVTKFLWPEVHKWARRILWAKLGRRPWNRDELRVLSLKLASGEAFAAVSDDHEKIEGAHADELLFVFDEAKAIPDKTWDAVEGAFSGSGAGKVRAYVLSISTPGEPQGRFFQIQSRAKGYRDWHVRRVLLEDVLAAGRVSPKWVSDRRVQWGEDSPIFQNRVLGEFAVVDDSGVVPLAWVERAQDRWSDFHARCGNGHVCDPGTMETIGVDPARSGEDKTAWATRYSDDHIYKITDRSGLTTMETTGFVKGLLDTSGARAVVDVIGIGAGVVDRLREMFDPKRVIAFNASESTSAKDSSREISFFNCRSAVWWHMREVLDPENGRDAMLPPDDELTGELTAPRWWIDSSGRIRVESKDEIRKRIGRSTNKADACIQAFWTDLLVRKLVIAAPVSGLTQINHWRAAG